MIELNQIPCIVACFWGFIAGWSVCHAVACINRRFSNNACGYRSLPRLAISKHSRNVYEIVRQLLRFELSVGSYLEGYAYNVGPFGTKVALASKYYLALRTGFYDFWDFVPLSRDVVAPLSICDDEKRARDCKCTFAVVDDGCTKTYVPAGPGIIVPRGYTCSRAIPEEVVEIIRNAKNEASNGDSERNPLNNV